MGIIWGTNSGPPAPHAKMLSTTLWPLCTTYMMINVITILNVIMIIYTSARKTPQSQMEVIGD